MLEAGRRLSFELGYCCFDSLDRHMSLRVSDILLFLSFSPLLFDPVMGHYITFIYIVTFRVQTIIIIQLFY